MAKKSVKRAPHKISDSDPNALLSVEEFEKIALRHALEGRHWETLSSSIYKVYGVKVAKDAIAGHIARDERNAAIKELCKAIVLDLWTDEMRSGDLPPAAWIFMKKNKALWRDRIDHVAEITVTEEQAQAMSLEELKKLAAQIINQTKTGE